MPVSEVLILLAAVGLIIATIMLLTNYEYDPVKPNISGQEVLREVIRLLQAWKYILILFWRPVSAAILLIVSSWLVIRFSLLMVGFDVISDSILLISVFLLLLVSFIGGYFYRKRRERIVRVKHNLGLSSRMHDRAYSSINAYIDHFRSQKFLNQETFASDLPACKKCFLYEKRDVS